MNLRNWADDGSDEEDGPSEEQEDKNSGPDPTAPQANLQKEREDRRVQDRDQQGQGQGQGQAQNPRSNYNDIPMNGPFVAFVGNLPFNITVNELGNFFHGGGCHVADVVIKVDEFKKPRGFAHVTFEDRDSLIEAFKATGCLLGGREIKVDFNSNKSSPRGGRMGGDRDNRGGGGGGGGGGDRDGGRESGRDGGREETEVSWVRAPKPVPVPPKPELRRNDSRDSRDGRDNRDNRGERDNRGGNSNNSRDNRDNRDNRDVRDNRHGPSPRNSNRDADQAPTPPAVRPKIVLAPRNIPLEGVEVSAKVSDIFGGGRPQDENKYEVRIFFLLSFLYYIYTSH